MFSRVCISVLVYSLFGSTEACDGFSLKVNQIGECSPDSILKMTDFTVRLTEDCKLVPTGCIEVTKTMNSAKVKYEVIRSGMPIRGIKDLCEALVESSKSSELLQYMNLFLIPTSCPVSATKVCTDGTKEIDITKNKFMLALISGNIKAKFLVDSDAGPSCIQFDGQVTQKK